MFPNRFRVIFCTILVLMLLPPGVASAASSESGLLFIGPARQAQQIDTETPTPTETETPAETPTETVTPTVTETPTETATPTLTSTLVATETSTETTTPTVTESFIPTATAIATIATSNRYIAPGGVDTGNCDQLLTPCASINYALGHAASSGDTIYVTQGTYTDIGTEVVLINKNITLSGGWNTDFTSQSGFSTIDGQSERRGVTSTGNPVVVDHFKIQHGSSVSGSGIFISQGSFTLNYSMVNDNVSSAAGGGIYNAGSTVINYSTISGNSADFYGAGGSGIYNEGSIVVSNSTLSGNTAPSLHDTSIYGIAIFNNGSATLNNTTVSSNSGSEFSYAIYNQPGKNLYIINSTVSNNVGGVRNNGSLGHVFVKNSIIADNTNYVPNCTGLITSAGYNLIGNTEGCTFTATVGDQLGTTDHPINPQLGSLQNNGGPTFTHALLPNSPAINAGNPAVIGSGGGACLVLDQRGIARAGDAGCDIGAYELTIPMVISIKRFSPDPTNKPLVSFVVTFTEPVTGVSNDDFSLTSTGLTSTSIVSVTGSGKIYYVAANTGSGNGTVRLNLIDNDSIEDASSNPLGGAGAGNGNFMAGETYSVQNTRLSSITLADPSPTGKSQVRFILKFAENVTGVNTTAPFSDFQLTTNVGASITSVSGAGMTYTITINTGTRNGYAHLNLLDDDSIKDDSGTPLGGIGVGNGKFTTGPSYSIITVPTPRFPQAGPGLEAGAMPTYNWTVVPTATYYQYDLFKGTTLIYRKTVSANKCDASYCSATPTNKITVSGAYRWRVRAMIAGVWKNFSAFKPFTVILPKPGLWKGAVETNGRTDFYVTPDGMHITHFTFYVTVPACNITNQPVVFNVVVPIVGINYYYTDATGVYFAGGFTSTTAAHSGSYLYHYYLPGCGYITNEHFSKNHTWQNSSQPSIPGN